MYMYKICQICQSWLCHWLLSTSTLFSKSANARMFGMELLMSEGCMKKVQKVQQVPHLGTSLEHCHNRNCLILSVYWKTLIKVCRNVLIRCTNKQMKLYRDSSSLIAGACDGRGMKSSMLAFLFLLLVEHSWLCTLSIKYGMGSGCVDIGPAPPTKWRLHIFL